MPSEMRKTNPVCSHFYVEPIGFKSQFHKSEEQNGSCQGFGVGGMGRCGSKGTNLQL